jgi:hypothetical protein
MSKFTKLQSEQDVITRTEVSVKLPPSPVHGMSLAMVKTAPAWKVSVTSVQDVMNIVWPAVYVPGLTVIEPPDDTRLKASVNVLYTFELE